MRLLFEREETVIAVLTLFQAIFVQVADSVYLHPDLLALAAGCDLQAAVGRLDRQ